MFAGIKKASTDMTEDEIRRLARIWHELNLRDYVAAGWHHPEMHRREKFNPIPRLRPDGQTFCDHCDSKIVPYGQLSGNDQKRVIAAVMQIERAFRVFTDKKPIEQYHEEPLLLQKMGGVIVK